MMYVHDKEQEGCAQSYHVVYGHILTVHTVHYRDYNAAFYVLSYLQSVIVYTCTKHTSSLDFLGSPIPNIK